MTIPLAHFIALWSLLSFAVFIIVAILKLRARRALRWPQVPTSPDLDLSRSHALTFSRSPGQATYRSCSAPIEHGYLCDRCLYNQLFLIIQHAARERAQYHISYLSPSSPSSHSSHNSH